MVDLASLPDMILDNNEPVFSEPWEAQAFAMVIALYEKGAFTWTEWAHALSAAIQQNPTAQYYKNWLNALENLVDEKNLVSTDALLERKNLWHEVAANTPHGEPIVLPTEVLPDSGTTK